MTANTPAETRPSRDLAVIQAFLYNADGHDKEVELDQQCLVGLDERTLLWVDVNGRDRNEVEHLTR
ncbi:hypothetical protein, partial [Microvirga yunnanensis]